MQERSPFSASLDVTLGALDRELRAISARDAELQVAIQPSAFRQDGRPNKRAIAEHPGVVLTFSIIDGGERLPVSFPCDSYLTWQDNLRAIVLSMEALRKVNRYGVTKRAEQYRGFAALPAGDGYWTMDHATAKRIIDGYGGARAALTATHPDTGGDAEKFREVQDARQVLGL